MPQPYRGQGPIFFDNRSPLRLQKLGAYMATVSTMATGIDMILGVTLAGFMQSDAAVGMSIYNAIENDGAKMAILRTMADRFLNEEGKEKFSALLRNIRKRQVDRNAVVHGLWGYAKEHPDCLIWMDPRDLQAHLAEFTAEACAGVASCSNDVLAGLPWQKAKVYCEQDFIEIEDRLDSLHKQASTFYKAHLNYKAP